MVCVHSTPSPGLGTYPKLFSSLPPQYPHPSNLSLSTPPPPDASSSSFPTSWLNMPCKGSDGSRRQLRPGPDSRSKKMPRVVALSLK